MKRFALAGNPNCGKTTLFNSLTGSTAHVGNWPGVTVEQREGTYKKVANIIDLPGIYSLSPYTPEEVISRNYILDEKPDAVINVVDATNLERNLYLTTQLLEIDVPVVVALNMMDIVKKNGETIDADELSKQLGVPVVAISAQKQENLDVLMKVALEEAEKSRKGTTVLEKGALAHLISDCEVAFSGIGVENPLFHAVKLVEMDELETKAHPDLINIVSAFKATFKDEVFGDDLEAIVANERYEYISKHFSKVKTTKDDKDENSMKKLTPSDKADKVLTNKWAGIPIFLVILFLIFHLTFSENLFFLGGLLKFDHPCFEGQFFEGLFFTEAGINSPGVILFNFLDSITAGLTDLVAGWMESSPEWLSGLVCDGILGGLFAVLSFLPQILALFFFFSILEDTGYMARVAFILDRIFRKFGLSGRSFMPMIMGFGCSVPAMINTRTLSDDNERTATIRVIPFFSCGAKLPILTAIAGGIVEFFNVGNADVITYSMYLLGMVTAIVAVIAMRHTSMRGKVPPFIMELPAYHAPQFKALMVHLWDKLKHFVKKAFTIILASTILIWVLSHVSFTNGWVGDEEINLSVLGSIGKVLQPIFTPLGFGSQLSTNGWVFVVAAITGLIAKENVIATFGALAAAVGAAAIDVEADGGDVAAAVAMISATGITIPGLIAFIAFNMTTIPCFAAVATAKAELPKKRFWTTLLFWLATSYIVSSLVYVVGSWWWTAFIFVALVVVICFAIYYFNKARDAKTLKSAN